MQGVGQNLQDHLEIYIQQVPENLKKSFKKFFSKEMHPANHAVRQVHVAPSAQHDPGWGRVVFDGERIGRVQPPGVGRVCAVLAGGEFFVK